MVEPREKDRCNNTGSTQVDKYDGFQLEPRGSVELTDKEKNFIRSLSCSVRDSDRQAAAASPGQLKSRPVIGDGSSHLHYHDLPTSPVPHLYQPHHHQLLSLNTSAVSPGNICMGMSSGFVQLPLQGSFIFTPLPPCYYNNGCVGPFIPGYHLPGDGSFKHTYVLDSLLPHNPISSVMDMLTPPPEKRNFNESPS
uniref:CTNNB1_binding domain-containing protein n=1 Tax=Strongyloides papillosus TaxID=174720 RepID=A0A0N5C5I3_STREA